MKRSQGCLGEICGAGDHYGWPHLGFMRAHQDADHDIAGLHAWRSDSSASRRRSEAALNSFRPSSEHESDQSIPRFGAGSASRSARRIVLSPPLEAGFERRPLMRLPLA